MCKRRRRDAGQGVEQVLAAFGTAVKRNLFAVDKKSPEDFAVQEPLAHRRRQANRMFQVLPRLEIRSRRIQEQNHARTAFHLEFLGERLAVTGKSLVVQVAQGIALAVRPHADKIHAAGKAWHQEGRKRHARSALRQEREFLNL